MKRMITFALTLALAIGTALGQQYNYYFGNLHAHTAYSDGNKDKAASHVQTPADSYRFAKQAQHLDFLGISEHNHNEGTLDMHLADYAKGLEQAKAACVPHTFLALYGMEFGVISHGGHVLIYGIDKLIGWNTNNYDIFCGKNDYDKLWQIVGNAPNAFAVLAHPEQDHFSSLVKKPYSREAEKAICGVALITGPAFSTATTYTDKPPVKFNTYYKQLLALGYMVGPTVDHDNHNTTFGMTTHGRTVVLAKELSADSIIAAYRARRFYASQDWNTKVAFTINGAAMGSFLKNTADAEIAVSIADEDVADKTKSIKIMYGKPGSGELPVQLASATNKEALNFHKALSPGETYYFYAEIVQQDGDKVTTAPVWVQR